MIPFCMPKKGMRDPFTSENLAQFGEAIDYDQQDN